MRKRENTAFTCEHCQQDVLAITNGSYRNHCPKCLYSKHLDELPGDRKSSCGGKMKPREYRFHGKKGYQIKHECQTCGKKQWNKIASNTIQADEFIEFMQKMLRYSL